MSPDFADADVVNAQLYTPTPAPELYVVSEPSSRTQVPLETIVVLAGTIAGTAEADARLPDESLVVTVNAGVVVAALSAPALVTSPARLRAAIARPACDPPARPSQFYLWQHQLRQ